MEYIKNPDDLPYSWELPPETLHQIMKAFNSGQYFLSEQILYYIEQIKISISLNDGNFCNLIDELEENLQNLAKGPPRELE